VKKALTVLGVVVFVAVAYLLLRGDPEPAWDEQASGRQDVAGTEETREPQERTREPGPPPSEERPDPRPVQATGPVPPPLPSLEESDAFVREQLEPFSLPSEWVAQENLLRRLTVLVDNASRGDLPHRQLRFLRPEARFEVVERDGALYAALDNGDRFDPHLDLLERIDPEAGARLLLRVEPLLEQAFEELGRSVDPIESMREVIGRILEMRVPPQDPELVQRKVLYEYADPELESLPPLEKQMMRLGARNLGRLQAYLVRLRTALDLEETL